MTIPTLLKNISADFFAENADLDLQELVENQLLDSIALQSKWLGYSPASTDEIASLESRLGVKLPSSFKEFLLNSNGFRNVSMFLDNLFPTSKIDWAKNTEDSWWFDLLESQEYKVSDKDYFQYSQPQDEIKFRGEYFRHSLKISEWHKGMCIFLNPIITFENEWEVLEYATWFPGTLRFKSFKDFLINTHLDNKQRIKNFS